MSFVAWGRRLIGQLLDNYGPARKIRIICSDSLPSKLPYRDLVLAREDGEDWCVGMSCPCGCGDIIELLIVAEANPRWDVKVDEKQRPTLLPSIWRTSRCGAHFWIRNGRVAWA